MAKNIDNLESELTDKLNDFIENVSQYIAAIKNVEAEKLSNCIEQYQILNQLYIDTTDFLKIYDTDFINLLNSYGPKLKKDYSTQDETKYNQDNQKYIIFLTTFRNNVNKYITDNQIDNQLVITPIGFTMSQKEEDGNKYMWTEKTNSSNIVVKPIIKCTKYCNRVFNCDFGSCNNIKVDFEKCVGPLEKSNQGMVLLSIISSISCSLFIVVMIIIYFVRRGKQYNILKN
jgi:hypothetical protein